mgnify:CR=1 FL=1|tara:strand:- start:344 stop:655 length:312 start_codon:yes stop_codon:yes gene_type:complete
MATKKATNVIEATAANVIKTTNKVNDFALKSTENVAMKTIAVTEKYQGKAHEAMTKGFGMAAKQQDKVFDILTDLKGKASKVFSSKKPVVKKATAKKATGKKA